MLRLLTSLVTSAVLMAAGSRACTTVIVGRLASAEGAAMVTGTNDCLDCDFRAAMVPSRVLAEGETLPVLHYHEQYPREVSERSPTYSVANLEPLPQRGAWAAPAWAAAQTRGRVTMPAGPTYKSIEALYGIINDAHLAMGE